jgi:hypothetical protein
MVVVGFAKRPLLCASDLFSLRVQAPRGLVGNGMIILISDHLGRLSLHCRTSPLDNVSMVKFKIEDKIEDDRRSCLIY